MASWVSTFYEALRTLPLAKAYELAVQVSHADMRLYPRMCKPHDSERMQLSWTADAEHPGATTS
jgi:hypothetical protein